MAIIIVLKINSRVGLGQATSYGERGLTRVELGQYKNKNDYYHNFKT
jgi:hypothetical protein